MANDGLRAQVAAELSWDPKVDSNSALYVTGQRRAPDPAHPWGDRTIVCGRTDLPVLYLCRSRRVS
jgi:hypothetical protein